MDLGVKGKVAFINGGGEGIGRIVARMLAEEGADIAVADFDAAEVENAAQQIVQPAPARQYTVTPDNKLATTWGQMKKYK